MSLTFHILTLGKYLTRNLDLFWGALFCTSKSGAFNEYPAPPVPHIYCRIFFYCKNGDVCGKIVQCVKIWRRYEGFKFEKKIKKSTKKDGINQQLSNILPGSKTLVQKGLIQHQTCVKNYCIHDSQKDSIQKRC